MKARGIVEAAGAEFVSISGNVVTIKDLVSGRKLQLYDSALRTVEDVRSALRSIGEKVLGFEPLLPTKK
jgi:hypothetical protein